MAPADDSQLQQQAFYDGSPDHLVAQYHDQEAPMRIPSVVPGNNYPAINVTGQASAILGNVHINTNDLTFLQAANPQYKKRLLLSALYFDSMSTRKAQIDARASSPKYVEWIWKSNFLAWLEGPDNFYWITGRPGSGKSTLMTHISGSSRTKQALAARGGQWKIVHFFFDFRAGKSLGNNIEGLLRSLFHQILRQVPEVAELIDLELSGGTAKWSLQTFLDALCNVFEGSSYRTCVFIDGLDEYEDSHTELLDVIQRIGERVSNIKLCLAGRPYPLFHDALGGFASIAMQDHNDQSIKAYTCAEWSSHRIDHRAHLPQDLSDRIRAKANGVFLWARLAVDELIIDFSLGKSLAELYAQLESMPSEVEDMYLRVLTRLSEPHQQEAAAILYMILQTNEPLAIDKIYAALKAMKIYGHAGQMILPIECEADNARRVLAILGDLTDQVPGPQDEVPYGKENDNLDLIAPRLVFENSMIRIKRERVTCISLTHETLRSFLTKSSWLTNKISPQMAANTGHDFWVNLYLTEISSLMLAGTRNHDLEHQISNSALLYRSELVDTYDSGLGEEVLKIARWRIQVSTIVTFQDHIHEIALIKMMKLWPKWSPLLLFALENIFDELSQLGSERLLLADRIRSLSTSIVFPLHTAICTFQFIDRSLRIGGKRGMQSHHNCASLRLLDMVGSMPSESMKHMKLEAMVAACHALDDFVPFLIAGSDIGHSEKQLIFDWVWETYIDATNYDTALTLKQSLMQLLIDTGCNLEGRHLCSFRRHDANPFTQWDATFVVDNLPDRELPHAVYCCNISCQNMLGHLEELSMQWGGYDLDGNVACKEILHALIDRGADLDEINLRTGETFLVTVIKAISFYYEGDMTIWPLNFCEWLRVLLESGANPHLRGKSGDAFMVASQLYDQVSEITGITRATVHEKCSSDCEGSKACMKGIHELDRILNVLEEYRESETRIDNEPDKTSADWEEWFHHESEN